MVDIPEPIAKLEKATFEPLPKADDGGLASYKEATDKRLADMEQLTKAILFVAVIGLIGVVVALSGIILDQVHFNNQTYSQQSVENSKIEALQSEVRHLKEEKNE